MIWFRERETHLQKSLLGNLDNLMITLKVYTTGVT